MKTELRSPSPLRDLAEQLATGATTPIDVTEAALARIADLEPDIHAWAHLDADSVRSAAARIQDSGPDGALWGVPVGVKDLIDVAGMPTRCGSELRSTEPATTDADCVARSRALGALPFGKTVTTEFGYFKPGPTRNPRALGHTPGGSSSGSAAAVAAGMVPLAFGTQTAGSLTRPASFCGVAGFVTAHGELPTAGITGLSPGLDTVGLLARTVPDLHFAWTALRDGTRAPVLEPSAPRRLRLWSGFELGEVSREMTAALRTTADSAESAGIGCRELDAAAKIVALTEHHHTVMAYEATRERAAEAAQTDKISAPLAELFATGAATAEADYRTALAGIRETRQLLLSTLDEDEAILGPAALGAAPPGHDATGTPILSRPWQAMGLPVVTIPGKCDSTGLPLGLQLIGRPGAEQRLFETAAWLESVL
ncbi:indoleacetamide hydrolase [Rhodococcus opacus]|uniref:Indoleacetamide hydrolase n=1 Tax=Rhodococcus opacus TaxID=37919 RepID=A0A1B1KE93_RHOOP|nr:amidase [Rhodococcus opacus]ANS30908.1 indoleacetamide hydrolase [Rhodococcus opacus]